MRAKLRVLEGSRVKFVFNNGKLILLPINDSDVIRITNGQRGVMAAQNSSVKVCGTSRSGSNPDSGLKVLKYEKK